MFSLNQVYIALNNNLSTLIMFVLSLMRILYKLVFQNSVTFYGKILKGEVGAAANSVA